MVSAVGIGRHDPLIKSQVRIVRRAADPDDVQRLACRHGDAVAKPLKKLFEDWRKRAEYEVEYEKVIIAEARTYEAGVRDGADRLLIIRLTAHRQNAGGVRRHPNGTVVAVSRGDLGPSKCAGPTNGPVDPRRKCLRLPFRLVWNWVTLLGHTFARGFAQGIDFVRVLDGTELQLGLQSSPVAPSIFITNSKAYDR